MNALFDHLEPVSCLPIGKPSIPQCTRPVLLVVLVVLYLVGLMAPGEAVADVVKSGRAKIPGTTPERFVKYRAVKRKSPGSTPKQVHFRLELELEDPQAGDNFTFIVCAMINSNKAAVDNKDYRIGPGTGADAGKWVCTETTPTPANKRAPNYHFGCKRVTLTGAKPVDASKFSDNLEFSVPVDEADLVDIYVDFLTDCPNGFKACDDVTDKQDRFLVPTAGTVAGTVVSTWVTDRKLVSLPTGGGDALVRFETGNFFTMGFMMNTYQCRLNGTFYNAPGGATITFVFPSSTGAGTQQFTVPGSGCLGDSLNVSIPFTISPSLDFDPDMTTQVGISFTGSQCGTYPPGVIEFVGEVVATNTTTFPGGGGTIYAAGDFMYDIHLQYIADYDCPYVVSKEARPVDSTTFEVAVRAADPTTSTVGATLRYSVNGMSQPDLAMPYDDPPVDGPNTLFRVVLGGLPPFADIEYQILLVDDGENVCSTAVADVHLPVELSRFDLSSHDKRVYLNWRTASEVRNAGFEVERAADGDSTFTRIASYLIYPELAGLGTSSMGKSYAFVDGSPLVVGALYRYRLADVSVDGVRTVHPAGEVRVEGSVSPDIRSAFALDAIVPNPVTDELTVTFRLPESLPVSITVYSMDGRVVAMPMIRRNHGSGDHAATISTDGLPSGTYLLRLDAGTHRAEERFVIAR